METNKEATPAPAATPSPAPVITHPVATPAPIGDKGNNQEGKVTIGIKEFTQLNRDAARARSLDRRNQINNRKNSLNTPTGDENADQAIKEANDRATDSERKALQFQVKSQVRDLLEKDEFKTLPKSTKELILKNPAMLSEADNLEEAMLDIEDFVREQVLTLETAITTETTKKEEPAGTTTPPTAGGGPAPAGSAELEDTSKLSGPAKSQATIRNLMRSRNKKT